MDVFSIFITIFLTVTLLYYYMTSTFSFWASKKVPFIKPKIFFGTMKDIITFKMSQPEKFLEFHNYFKQKGYSYGGIFELSKPVLLLCTPDLIKDVMIKNFPSFHDRGFPYDEKFDPLSAHLVMLEGQRWKYLRSKLSPAFSTGKLKGMTQYFSDASEPLLRILEKMEVNGDEIDIPELLARYTTDVIALCAFGLNLNAVQGESEFRNIGRKIFEPSQKEKILQIVRNTYPWIYKTFKLRQYSREITDYFISCLRETITHRKKNNIEKNDFLSYLMKIKDAKGMALKDMKEMENVMGYNMSVQDDCIELTEGVIAAQAFIFFLAGFETTSSTLSFCFYELAENPEIQKKVQEEISETFKKHGEVNYEFLSELKYMEQVLQETLRKYAPIPLLLRICTIPYRIPDTDIIIPPGTQVFIAPYSLHHDPEYFPNPDKFDPERFSTENREKIIPYSYLPFGDGPRVCIGMRFAMLEMKMLLVKVLKNFTLVKCEKTKPIRIDPSSFIIKPIDGIFLKTMRR